MITTDSIPRHENVFFEHLEVSPRTMSAGSHITRVEIRQGEDLVNFFLHHKLFQKIIPLTKGVVHPQHLICSSISHFANGSREPVLFHIISKWKD